MGGGALELSNHLQGVGIEGGKNKLTDGTYVPRNNLVILYSTHVCSNHVNHHYIVDVITRLQSSENWKLPIVEKIS